MSGRGRKPFERGAAVEEELRFHIEQHAADLMREGVPCDVALARAEAAFRDLGGTRAALERMYVHRARRESLVEMAAGMWMDTRRAVRGLARRPGLALLAVCTLGLGIGANATMFGLVKRLLLSAPPHIEAAEQLVVLRYEEAQTQAGRITWVGTSYPSFVALREARGFDGVAGYTRSAATMVEGGVADAVELLAVSEEYFDVLGVRASLGSLPRGDQVADESWAVIGHGLWMRRFDGSRDVLGRELTLGDASFRIVGVLPRGFTGVDLEPGDVWIPITAPLPGTATDWRTNDALRSVFLAARLAVGMPRDEAGRLATATYRAARSGLPEADSTARVILRSPIPGVGEDGSPATPEAKVTVWLQATSILVLLIALFNVQNLFLLRAMERQRETAIARALGITRLRFVRMVALEYAVVALAGALLSLVLVRVAAPALWLLVLPPGTDIGALTREVTGAALAVAAATAVVLTIVTAFVQGRVDVGSMLREGGRGSTMGGNRLREILVVAQVAMTFVLAVGAGLFVRSLMKIGDVEWGYDMHRVAAVHLSPPRLGLDADATSALAERVVERLRGMPGVEATALGLTAPLRPSLGQPFRLPGQEALPGVGQGGLGYPTYFAVSPEYFDVVNIALLRGRGFTPADHAGSAPVAMVDATMARTFWPEGDALGQCIHLGEDPAPCTTVVGVVADTRRTLDRPHSLRYFLPITQNRLPFGGRYVFVRAGDAAPLDVAALRSSLAELHVQAGAAEIVMLNDLMEPYVRPWRLGSSAFLVFGILSQIVAALGLYGVLAFGVAQRRRELGIRVALGASRAEITRLIVGGAVRRVLVAITCGLVVALLAGRLIRGLLFQTAETDPLVLVVVAGLALLTAIGASAVPLLRALRVDPARSLRID